MFLALPPLLFAASLLSAVGPAPRPREEAAGTHFVPDAALDLRTLERLIGERTPAIEAADLELELAAAEHQQSRLLPNPQLDLGWGTVPVGPLNPPGLTHPLANVPNYAVGLSYTVPVGKRRPRMQRAQALVEASRASRSALTRALSLRFAGLLGQLAVATLRREGVRSLVEARRKSGAPHHEAIMKGAAERLRPVLMTAALAALGLLPAAFSHAMGAETQRGRRSYHPLQPRRRVSMARSLRLNQPPR